MKSSVSKMAGPDRRTLQAAAILFALPLLVCGSRYAAAQAAAPTAASPLPSPKCDEKPIPPEQQALRDKACRSTGLHAPSVFIASGGDANLKVSGTVSDPTKPFALHGTFPGGASVHKFTPTGNGGGTSTYTMSGSGVTGSGRGTYTLRRVGADWAVRDTNSGCVNGIPNSCRTNTENIKLTARAAK